MRELLANELTAAQGAAVAPRCDEHSYFREFGDSYAHALGWGFGLLSVIPLLTMMTVGTGLTLFHFSGRSGSDVTQFVNNLMGRRVR